MGSSAPVICSECSSRNPEGVSHCERCGHPFEPWAPTAVGPLPEGPAADPTVVGANPMHDGGQTIGGRYRLEELLGRGGAGMVYRARDLELDEEIAIKVLNSSAKERDPHELERFKREIITARRITHPNVVRIHEFWSAEKEVFISMQLLTGGTLADRIEKGFASLEEAVSIAAGICEGLAAAHAEGIIHRDLKPENVLFDAHGRPKLCDFGLARLADSNTRTVGFSGTPFYMSPEHADGSEVTVRSDVYSLGVVLFEMFTGRLPFLADSLLRLVMQHTKEPPPSPRSIRPDLPVSIEAVVLKAMAKRPEDRHASVSELLADLRNWRSPASDAVPPRPPPTETVIRPIPVAPPRSSPMPLMEIPLSPGPAASSGRRTVFAAGAAVALVLLAGLGYSAGIGKLLTAATGATPVAGAGPSDPPMTSAVPEKTAYPPATQVAFVPTASPDAVASFAAPTPSATAAPTAHAIRYGRLRLEHITSGGRWFTATLAGEEIAGEMATATGIWRPGNRVFRAGKHQLVLRQNEKVLALEVRIAPERETVVRFDLDKRRTKTHYEPR